MHTKHGLALEPVQLFLNLIATQCRVSELLGQCFTTLFAQAVLADEYTGEVIDVSQGLVRLDVDPPVRTGVRLSSYGGHNIYATNGSRVIART